MAGDVGDVEREVAVGDAEVIDEVAGKDQRRHDAMLQAEPSMAMGLGGSMPI
jgi:hypothetical protein